MPIIRILIGELEEPIYRFLSDAFAAQHDLEHVGRPGLRGIELLMESRRKRPDVVVFQTRDGELPGESSHLLAECPQMKIMAIDDGRVIVSEMRPHNTVVPCDSADGLIETLRSFVK